MLGTRLVKYVGALVGSTQQDLDDIPARTGVCGTGTASEEEKRFVWDVLKRFIVSCLSAADGGDKTAAVHLTASHDEIVESEFACFVALMCESMNKKGTVDKENGRAALADVANVAAVVGGWNVARAVQTYRLECL